MQCNRYCAYPFKGCYLVVGQIFLVLEYRRRLFLPEKNYLQSLKQQRRTEVIQIVPDTDTPYDFSLVCESWYTTLRCFIRFFTNQLQKMESNK